MPGSWSPCDVAGKVNVSHMPDCLFERIAGDVIRAWAAEPSSGILWKPELDTRDEVRGGATTEDECRWARRLTPGCEKLSTDRVSRSSGRDDNEVCWSSEGCQSCRSGLCGGDLGLTHASRFSVDRCRGLSAPRAREADTSAARSAHPAPFSEPRACSSSATCCRSACVRCWKSKGLEIRFLSSRS